MAMAVRERTWMPRRIRFTAEGAWFTLLALGVGFAALNTGNNLLYLVLGMMLTVIAVSGILSELSVGRLSADRRVPDEIYAGRPTSVTLTLYNLKPRFPALGVDLREWGLLDLAHRGAWFVRVPAGEAHSKRIEYTFSRRGLHNLRGFVVGTNYPFGLFNRSYRLELAQQVVVFPALKDVDERGLLSAAAVGQQSTVRRGQGEEFYGLRDLTTGDDARLIHWKSSARRARPVVRESTFDGRRRVIVRLEPGADPDLAGFEDAVSLAASWVHHHIGHGYMVGFEGPGEAIPPGDGRGQLRRILRSLALLGPADRPAQVPATPGLTDLRVVVRVVGARGVATVEWPSR